MSRSNQTFGKGDLVVCAPDVPTVGWGVLTVRHTSRWSVLCCEGDRKVWFEHSDLVLVRRCGDK